jgi:phenylalanyl-tRNA synthetase beta chain
MQFSEAWLRSLVNPQLDTQALAHALTMGGLEVEGVAPVAPAFDHVVVARILECAKHPDADRLRVCRVDVGEPEPITIVCGAANAAAGLRVPCARPGAKLPGMEIRVAKVRGVESFGMLCSAKELGLAADADGLMVLDDDAPVGEDLRRYLDLDDRVITLKLTPNRADCLSIVGLAREVGALTRTAVHPVEHADVAPQIDDTRDVQVLAPDACPRYVGRVIKGIDAGAATPRWMKARLERSGIRPLSAPVDVTNYVMLELGQPMHAFSLERLVGGIAVRHAQAGESLVLLNGERVDLSPDMLVIADETGPIALAGIMGGEATGVAAGTRDVFLEAAFFAPRAIAGRARRLGLSSDAAFRFERGVDFARTHEAMARATRLMTDICGGHAGPVVERVGALPRREPIRLDLGHLQRVAGVALASDAVRQDFLRLGMEVEADAGALVVTPPSFRFDIEIAEDLIEEAVRLYGYDNIPAQPPCAAVRMLPQAESRRGDETVKQMLVDRDYQEVITYSFVDPAWERALSTRQALALANPLATQLSVMRTTLWGGLIDAMRHNLNRQQTRVRLFELGRVFLSGDGRIEEPLRVGGVAIGDALPEQWGAPQRAVDFFDVKGDIETLLGAGLVARRATHPALHPGQSAELIVAGRAVGWLGALHPRLVEHFDLPGVPLLFEFDAASAFDVGLPRYTPISRFPQVRRDMALVVAADVAAGDLLGVLQQAATAIVREIALFDEYRGKGLADSEKSLAFRVVMQDTQRTLTDAEVDETMAALVAAAARAFGARLRQ